MTLTWHKPLLSRIGSPVFGSALITEIGYTDGMIRDIKPIEPTTLLMFTGFVSAAQTESKEREREKVNKIGKSNLFHLFCWAEIFFAIFLEIQEICIVNQNDELRTIKMHQLQNGSTSTPFLQNHRKPASNQTSQSALKALEKRKMANFGQNNENQLNSSQIWSLCDFCCHLFSSVEVPKMTGNQFNWINGNNSHNFRYFSRNWQFWNIFYCRST